MEAIENLHSYQVYTYGKAAATVATAGVSYATGSLAAAVSAVGLSILFLSQQLTTALQPKSLLSHSFVKLALSAALATIAAVAYLSIAGVPLIAAEVAYIASLFLIPTLAEICIEAASVALSSKKISPSTKTPAKTISPLIDWMNQREDYRDTEVKKAENREAEIKEKHSPLPFLLKGEKPPVAKQKGVEWEAYQAIEALENKVKKAIEEWKNEDLTNRKSIEFTLRLDRPELFEYYGYYGGEDPRAALKQKVQKMVTEAVVPFLERGSIHALDTMSGVHTLDLLTSVEEQYKGLHLYSFYLGRALFQSRGEKASPEIQKILKTLVEKGFSRAFDVVKNEGKDLGFDEAFIESCTKRLMESGRPN